MQTPTPADIQVATQVLRRFKQYLNDHAVRSAVPGTRTGHPEAIEPHVLDEMQNVDDIIAKLVAWADQLKQRQVIRKSYGQSL
ncbi:MAG: hypothetical protein IPK15_12180 [Verrucomicrobia bacterium]|nr:hypothetical protein [Verrucomicrobiota bacterium]